MSMIDEGCNNGQATCQLMLRYGYIIPCDVNNGKWWQSALSVKDYIMEREKEREREREREREEEYKVRGREWWQ